MKEIKDEAAVLAQTSPLELSEESRFLLEIDGSISVNRTYIYLKCWIGVVKTANVAGQRMVRKRQQRGKTIKTLMVEKLDWRD